MTDKFHSYILPCNICARSIFGTPLIVILHVIKGAVNFKIQPTWSEKLTWYISKTVGVGRP